MHSAAGDPTTSVSLTDFLTRKSNAPSGGPHFRSNSPLYRAERESNARGLPGRMGGFGIDWYITANKANHMTRQPAGRLALLYEQRIGPQRGKRETEWSLIAIRIIVSLSLSEKTKN